MLHKINLLIITSLFILSSCQEAKNSNEKITESAEVQDSVLNNFSEEDFSYGFNAEVNHMSCQFYKMKELINTDSYNNTYFLEDGSLYQDKNITYNYFDNNFQDCYYKTIQGDVDKADTATIFEEFRDRNKNLIEKIKERDEGNVSFKYIKSSLFELHYKVGNRMVSQKNLLCNVVGGSHAIVEVKLIYMPKRKKLALKILEGYDNKYI